MNGPCCSEGRVRSLDPFLTPPKMAVTAPVRCRGREGGRRRANATSTQVIVLPCAASNAVAKAIEKAWGMILISQFLIEMLCLIRLVFFFFSGALVPVQPLC